MHVDPFEVPKSLKVSGPLTIQSVLADPVVRFAVMMALLALMSWGTGMTKSRSLSGPTRNYYSSATHKGIPPWLTSTLKYDTAADGSDRRVSQNSVTCDWKNLMLNLTWCGLVSLFVTWFFNPLFRGRPRHTDS